MSRTPLNPSLLFLAFVTPLAVGCAGEDGADGTSYVTDINDEPAGANCADGGVRIDTGPDENGDGSLGAGEITKTEYVCMGGGGGGGGAQIVKQFKNAEVLANTGAPVTILSAAVTTTGPGKLLALGTTETFCTEAQCPAANSPAAEGYLWVASVDNLGVPATEFSYFFLRPNETENFSRSEDFPITAAGTHTFYLRGQDDAGVFGFYRSGLTLVFLPD